MAGGRVRDGWSDGREPTNAFVAARRNPWPELDGPCESYRSGKSNTHDRNLSNHAFPRVTANGFPSRRHTPDSGWVTLATAGLLARGSRRLPGLPSFPVAIVGARSPLTVAGAARASIDPLRGGSVFPCSLLPPRREPALPTLICHRYGDRNHRRGWNQSSIDRPQARSGRQVLHTRCHCHDY